MTRLFHIHKLNSEICIDVINNDVILLRFERFCQQALNFQRLYLSSYGFSKIGRVPN